MDPRGPELRTERLILRRWNDADRDAFAAPGWHGRRHVLYRLSAAEWWQYRSPS